jgi:hypothetical protein
LPSLTSPWVELDAVGGFNVAEDDGSGALIRLASGL